MLSLKHYRWIKSQVISSLIFMYWLSFILLIILLSARKAISGGLVKVLREGTLSWHKVSQASMLINPCNELPLQHPNNLFRPMSHTGKWSYHPYPSSHIFPDDRETRREVPDKRGGAMIKTCYGGSASEAEQKGRVQLLSSRGACLPLVWGPDPQHPGHRKHSDGAAQEIERTRGHSLSQLPLHFCTSVQI